jgi:hypothetical protein
VSTSSRIVVQFKGKITMIDGVRYVKVPRLTPSHVIQGERLHVTATAITARADLLHVNDGFRSIADMPRTTHVSGQFIGTFQIDLGTRPGHLEADQRKREILKAAYNVYDSTSGDGRGALLNVAYGEADAAVIAAFAEHD